MKRIATRSANVPGGQVRKGQVFYTNIESFSEADRRPPMKFNAHAVEMYDLDIPYERNREAHPGSIFWETGETGAEEIIYGVRDFCATHPYKGGEYYFGIEIESVYDYDNPDADEFEFYIDTRDIASGKQTLDEFVTTLRKFAE